MKVLVTGANGMLGQDLCPILEDAGYEVIETDIDNLDITNLENIIAAFEDEFPDMVIHCAAYTEVDNAENNLELAKTVNKKGTENIAKVCAKNNVPLVYISTDYVFDGTKNSPYLPSDLPNPINNYGLTKYLGEEVVKKHCKKFYIIRTSWLYGHHGKNFVETMLSLKNSKELKVVDDQKGSPTWTADLANAILEIINEPYGIYHACGAGEATWYEFAKEIFNLQKINVNLYPCSTKDFPRPAKRPVYSVMDNGNSCRHWKLALKDYLELRIDDEVVG